MRKKPKKRPGPNRAPVSFREREVLAAERTAAALERLAENTERPKLHEPPLETQCLVRASHALERIASIYARSLEQQGRALDMLANTVEGGEEWKKSAGEALDLEHEPEPPPGESS